MIRRWFLPGADPGVSANDQIEADLDLEWSGAIARNATIVYVYSPNVFESLEYAVDQNLAPVVSNSYGGCEIGSSTSWRTLAQQANAQGITWMNASGDSGAAGCDAGGKIATARPVRYLSRRHTGSHGGRRHRIQRRGRIVLEQSKQRHSVLRGFVYSRDRLERYGFGQRSRSRRRRCQRPLRKTLVADRPRRAQRSGPRRARCFARRLRSSRCLCDLLQRGVDRSRRHLGVFTVVRWNRGHTESISGRQRNVVKAGLGNINPTLYSLAQGTTGLFHDITAGNNIVPCATGVAGCVSGSYGFKAGTGYDLATGLGSVDAYNLVTRWNSLPSAVGTTLTLLATPASIAATATAQLTASVSAVTGTATPTGVVTFASGSTPLGSVTVAEFRRHRCRGPADQGSALAAGLNSITATFSGTGNFSGSTAAGVTVTVAMPAIATLISVTANPASITQSASTVLTATVKLASGNGTPTGSVSFTLGSVQLGSATLIASSTGAATGALTVKGSSLAAGPNAIVGAYASGTGISGSTASPITITVAAAPSVVTGTVVTASPTTIAQTASTAVTAMVKPSTGTALPTGTVAFTLGNIPLGTLPLSSGGSAAGVTLLIKASSLALGSNTITAAYSGSAGFAGSGRRGQRDRKPSADRYQHSFGSGAQ